MSSLRSLIPDLAARNDGDLRRLLAARPDLWHPPVADFAALAARAASRASLSRALDNLDRPTLQVLQVLVLAGPAVFLDAARVAALLSGRAGNVPPDVVVPLLDSLHCMALVCPDPTRRGPLAGYAAVDRLSEVLGAHPAGLGRSYPELAAASATAGAQLQRAAAAWPVTSQVPDLEPGPVDGREGNPTDNDEGGPAPGVQRADEPSDPARCLSRRVTAAGKPAALLEGAPAGSTELLERFAHRPLGRLGKGRFVPAAGSTPRGSGRFEPDDPLDWLLLHGLLVAIDDEHVELPAEMGRLLRGGHVIDDFSAEPPPVDLPRVRAALSVNASREAVAASVRIMADLLQAVGETPVATLRTGGVGVREVRRLAAALAMDPGEVGVYLELAAISGLIVLDPDTSLWCTAATGWQGSERADQWLELAKAWLAADRLSHPAATAGSRSPAHPPGPAVPSGTVLSAGAHRQDLPELRRRALAVLAELAGPVPAPGTAGAKLPAPDPSAILKRFAWHHPRQAPRLAPLLDGLLAEAELLGLAGSGALTDIGRAVAEEDWERARTLVREALPAPVEQVVLQADLTAVAPGFLSPDLAAGLRLLADPEGKGPATIYRFSPASLGRALDAGRSGKDILSFLSAHCATPVPQPLAYLVQDTAARHGRVTVGSGTCVRCEDPELLAELLAGEAFARFEFMLLAPTVLFTDAPAADVSTALAAAGQAPAALTPPAPADQAVRDQATDRAAKNQAALNQAALNGAALHQEALNEQADLAAQLAVLRRPAGRAGSGEAGPALILDTLRSAIRSKCAVSLTIVSSTGDVATRVLLPLSVAGGRVRAFDPEGERELVFTIHRILDAELAGGAGPTGKANND